MIKGKIQFALFGVRWLPISWKIKVPESFEELSHKQLLWYIENIYPNLSDWFEVKDDKVQIKDVDSFNQVQIETCRILMNVPLWLFRTIGIESMRNLLMTWQTNSFLFNSTYDPKKNPVPRLAGYYGPVSSEHFVPWEFSFGDAFYLRYKSTKSDSDLDAFIAQYFRPYKQPSNSHEQYTTDLRESYNHESDALRIPSISKASKAEKLLFLYWYEQWRNRLPKLFKHLFSKSNDKKASKQHSWLPIFSSAANGIHNLELIKYMNLLVLFNELNRIMKHQEEMERKAKAKK